jgi:predicted MFS family arabinose efflux permease
VIFFLNVPIGTAAVIAAWHILKGTTADMPSHESFDWPGAICLLALFFGLMTWCLHVGKWDLTSMRMVGLALAALVAAVLLVLAERNTDYPIVDGQILKNRFFMVSVMCAVILFAGLFTITFLMPFYLMRPAGLSAQTAGYVLMIPFVFLFFFSPLSGWIADRAGSRVLCFAGMGGLTAALFAFSTLRPSLGLFAEIWRLGLAGVGVALFLPPYTSSAISAVSIRKRGIASGTIAAARNFGMVTGVALSGLIFSSTFTRISGGLNANVYAPRLEPIFLDAFHAAMMASALLVACGWILTFFRGKRPRGHE